MTSDSIHVFENEQFMIGMRIMRFGKKSNIVLRKHPNKSFPAKDMSYELIDQIAEWITRSMDTGDDKQWEANHEVILQTFAAVDKLLDMVI